MVEKKRIAVIEDNEQTRNLLKILLEGEGYEVIGAATGIDIVKSMVEKKPD